MKVTGSIVRSNRSLIFGYFETDMVGFCPSSACDTTVSVALAFGGGKLWSISPADFRLQQITGSTCLGAFFEINSSGSSPDWIVGDTFLVRFPFTSSLISVLTAHWLRGVGIGRKM